MEGGRLRDEAAHGGWTVFLFSTLTYWLAIGNCRCVVTEAITTQVTNVDLEVNSQCSKRKKKSQIKQQVDDKGYPSKFFPITEKKLTDILLFFFQSEEINPSSSLVSIQCPNDVLSSFLANHNQLIWAVSFSAGKHGRVPQDCLWSYLWLAKKVARIFFGQSKRENKTRSALTENG